MRVDDQHVAVRAVRDLAADRMVDQPLEEAHLARPDHDQVRVLLLRQLDDRVGDVADCRLIVGGDALAFEVGARVRDSSACFAGGSVSWIGPDDRRSGERPAPRS